MNTVDAGFVRRMVYTWWVFALAALLALAIVTVVRAQGAAGTVGRAACYSKKLIGHKTSSGDKYDPHQLSMGSAHYPLGTKVKITNLKNQLSTVAVVNDRMSAHAGGKRHHIIADVSQEVCRQLDFPKGGEAQVSLEVVQ